MVCRLFNVIWPKCCEAHHYLAPVKIFTGMWCYTLLLHSCNCIFPFVYSDQLLPTAITTGWLPPKMLEVSYVLNEQVVVIGVIISVFGFVYSRSIMAIVKSQGRGFPPVIFIKRRPNEAPRCLAIPRLLIAYRCIPNALFLFN